MLIIIPTVVELSSAELTSSLTRFSFMTEKWIQSKVSAEKFRICFLYQKLKTEMSNVLRHLQSQSTSAGSNLDGCVDSTETLVYYYLEISKYLSQCASMSKNFEVLNRYMERLDQI